VKKAYYLYKQLSRAGQAGTAVVEVSSSYPDMQVIAFGKNGSKHPNAFVLVNTGDGSIEAQVQISGAPDGGEKNPFIAFHRFFFFVRISRIHDRGKWSELERYGDGADKKWYDEVYHASR